MKKLYVLITIIILSLLSNYSFSNNNAIVRYAFAIGANNGGAKREVLRYAVTDARSFIHVLTRMGGVKKNKSKILVNPNKKLILHSFNKLAKKIQTHKNESKRVELFFYYSGHADEEGILLKKDKISYKKIRDMIKSIDADVKIAILDSCSSGGFTRIKGGKVHKPFIVDTSFNMKGYAFMTSSSINEASQESDRIKGSFFTHYLVTGLRGAADATKDGRVTLNEAYQYAYQ